MSTPKMSLWPRGGVLALVFVASSCVEPGVSRIRAQPARPRSHAIRKIPAADPDERGGDSELAASSRPAKRPPQAESVMLVPLHDDAMLSPESQVLPESQEIALALEPDPTPSRVDLRGSVELPGNGQLPQARTHLVVFALPSTEPAAENLSLESPPDTPTASHIKGGFFPEFVVTSREQGIRFENRDQICHSFFSSSGLNAFDLGMLNPGESKTVDFEHAGPVQVYCSLHAGKQMSLFVAPTPHHALVEADGRFVLEGLVPGDYHLRAWGEGLRSRRLPVRVSGEAKDSPLIQLHSVTEKGVE